MDRRAQRIPARDLVRYYLRLGLPGFGGPVALMARWRGRWSGERRWRSYYGSLFRGGTAASTTRPFLPVAPQPTAGVAKGGLGTMLGELFAFLLKAGSLTSGGGLVIVPFLEKGLVQQTAWLGRRECLVAVAMGMISPGRSSSPRRSSAISWRASGVR